MHIGTNDLNTIIQNEIIAHSGLLSFAHFMGLALYHPVFGYYNRKEMDVGKAGDFTTASEISPLFAHCFATQCLDLSTQLGTTQILELGAGTGRFAGELLTELQRLGACPQNYYIYEISSTLREKQRVLLSTHYPAIAEQVTWLTELPTDFNGIVLANEVLDALPVNCFRIDDHGVQERYVGMQEGEYIWKTGPCSPGLAQAVARIQDECILPIGYESEINLGLHEFLYKLITGLNKAVILLADYGYGQREYYHPQRQRGTLTCFYQHHHHDNPLLRPGLQDITAHVDFTRVIEIAADLGCTLGGFTTQAGFLLASDLIERASTLAETLSTRDQFNLQQQIKTLTMPTEMGERVRVMALEKNCEINLPRFKAQDRIQELV